MHKLDKDIVSVSKLLAEPLLAIPGYQRPYKWTQKNLHALLSDLRLYREKMAYRLGSVVFHSHHEHGHEQLDIVDGQQRTLTLVLLVKAIIDERLEELLREDLKIQLIALAPKVEDFLIRQHFSSEISHTNLHQNFMAAKRAVARADFTEADIDFLLNRCELVTFVLTDVSEAFQFFDSQNARGRDLDPHDLLKAFHLREFSDKETDLKAQTVSHWESLDTGTLARAFANYLYRIRHWAQGKSAQHFNKDKVDLFKGVNLDRVANFPYVESLRIAHHFVDDYNQHYHRRIDQQKMRFPFHLDQMIINGRRFFEMTDHYQQLISHIIDDERHGDSHRPVRLLGAELDAVASRIIYTLNTYRSRTRTGDKYIRTLFDCALIFYIDKFGAQDISAAIEKLFIWAYSCRLKMQIVQLATMDNYALGSNVFKRMTQATQPNDLLSMSLTMVDARDIKGTKLNEITTLFKELKYCE
jgi:hypothetical protein